MPVYSDPVPGGITTIIQGPINETSLKMIPNYLRIGPVVIHAWDFNQGKQRPWRLAPFYNKVLLQIKEEFGDRVKIIISPIPEESKNIEAIHSDRWSSWAKHFASSTFHFAMYGISDALRYVKTEYVLRTRSDEAYADTDFFVEALCKDPNKFVMGNIFVAPMREQEFHIGDHIYACKAENLYHATNQLASFYYGYNKEVKWFYFQCPLAFEQVLAYSWMDCAGVDMELALRPENIENIPLMINSCQEVKDIFLSNSTQSGVEHRKIKKQIIHDYFHVIDINKTTPFVAKWNHGGKTYKNEFTNPHKVYSIGDMLHDYA